MKPVSFYPNKIGTYLYQTVIIFPKKEIIDNKNTITFLKIKLKFAIY